MTPINFRSPTSKPRSTPAKANSNCSTNCPDTPDFISATNSIYNADDAKKVFIPENKPRLEKLRDAFAALNTFDAATLETALKETAKQLGVKAGVLIHPMRLAATGNPHGPSLYHLLEVLGKEKSLARIEMAMTRF